MLAIQLYGIKEHQEEAFTTLRRQRHAPASTVRFSTMLAAVRGL